MGLTGFSGPPSDKTMCESQTARCTPLPLTPDFSLFVKHGFSLKSMPNPANSGGANALERWNTRAKSTAKKELFGHTRPRGHGGAKHVVGSN